MNKAGRSTIFTSLIFILFLAAHVAACSCREAVPVYQEFAAARDVVIMKAVSAVKLSEDHSTGDNMVQVMKFAVQKVFKGAMKSGQELDMTWTGMCDFGFYREDVGEEFLFYYYNNMYFMVPPCTRSGRVKWRGADLSWIENRNKVRGMTRISGTISQYLDTAIAGEKPESLTLKDHTVRVMGNGRDIRLRTDEHGVFEVYALPPGQYRVAPEKLKGYMPTNSIRTRTDSVVVRIGSNGQAEANFYFTIDNAIRGKVLDADGRPLGNVSLELLPAHGQARKYFVEKDTSNSDGSFEFKSIPPGTFVIVGNSKNEITAENPYPLFYSSGTDNLETATKITIGPGDVLEGFTVRAPRPAEVVTVSGRLLFADGTPVSRNATVRFVTGDGEKRAPGDSYAYTDMNGKFKLKVLNGRKGIVYAYVVANDWTFRDCLDRLKTPEYLASKGKEDYPESSRSELEISGDMMGIEIRFPFSLCAGK